MEKAAYIIENGKVFTLDKDGEKKSEATGLSLPPMQAGRSSIRDKK